MNVGARRVLFGLLGTLVLAVLPGLVALPVLARSVPAEDPPPDVVFQADVEYARVGEDSLRLNLSIPKGASGRLPVVVVIHGGAWRHGDRAAHDDLTWMFAQKGYVSATVGYRFVPEHRFPAQVEDVERAVRFLREHAEEYHVDPERVGAVGFSAGAHLALMLGTRAPAEAHAESEGPEDSDGRASSKDGRDEVGSAPGQGAQVQAVVSFFGPTDFALPSTEEGRPLFEDFLGGTLAERPEVYRLASPASHVDAGDAPMLLFQGTADHLVPTRHATRMAEALQAAGVPGRIELIVGAGHADWEREEYVRASAAMLAFFDEHLAD